MNKEATVRPAILAPAGNRASFLSALAAGADAVYCGLKNFSARMEAKNFSIEELAALTRLAHEQGTKVYVTFNSLLKPGEIDMAGKLVDQLNRHVEPDALIIQDIALIRLARQTGFSGEIHLSTLANVSFPEALRFVKQGFGPEIKRVVLPRELNVDEVRMMAAACPEGLDLEVFIHGALCYGVSGRCYWSSYMGGKSGLRGRCVQPCRRRYTQNEPSGKRFFSCQDLSLDVLVKVLADIPQIKVWKIEGRKKSPHYVYYTTQAYQMLRDHSGDSKMRKAAVELLARSLGRTGTHYFFLPQRPQNPVNTETQTGSGLLMGLTKGSRSAPFLVPREELLPDDVLRIGYEDESGHAICRVGRHVPKGGRFELPAGKRDAPGKNTPVFLTDRREKALADMIRNLEKKLPDEPFPAFTESEFRFEQKFRNPPKNAHITETEVHRNPARSKDRSASGFWLSDHTLQNASETFADKLWWWLPPVIWPNEEAAWKGRIHQALDKGSRCFVLNAPWQLALFPDNKKPRLWAGPFCNAANSLAIDALADAGFQGVIVSPELDGEALLKLPRQTRIPLGIVLSGNWPLCVSRIMPESLKTEQLFASPKGENAWARQHGETVWVWPDWQIDIEEYKEELRKAGYRLFIRLREPLPAGVTLKKRPGLWNWKIDLS